jgi:hypothetical protein
VTAAIGVAFSPVYLPRLLNAMTPNRSPVDINVQWIPGTARSSPSPPGSAVGLGLPSAAPAGAKPLYEESGQEWVLRSPITQSDIDAMNNEISQYSPHDQTEAFDAFIKSRGAADAHETPLRLTLQGVDQKVSITGMHANVRERAPMFAGTFIATGQGGEGSPISVDLPLDGPNPTAAYFASKVITVGADETVTIDLHASAQSSFVSWDLVIDFVVAGQTRPVVVQPPYGHFRTSGIPGSPDGSHDHGYDLRKHYQSLAYFRGSDVDYWTDYSPTD